jgi:hypothetical protein
VVPPTQALPVVEIEQRSAIANFNYVIREESMLWFSSVATAPLLEPLALPSCPSHHSRTPTAIVLREIERLGGLGLGLDRP